MEHLSHDLLTQSPCSDARAWEWGCIADAGGILENEVGIYGCEVKSGKPVARF